MRRLALALTDTFWGRHSPQGQRALKHFSGAQRWAVDEDLLYAAQGALNLTLASYHPPCPEASPGQFQDQETDDAPEVYHAAPGAMPRSSADLLTLANSVSLPLTSEGLGDRLA